MCAPKVWTFELPLVYGRNREEGCEGKETANEMRSGLSEGSIGPVKQASLIVITYESLPNLNCPQS